MRRALWWVAVVTACANIVSSAPVRQQSEERRQLTDSDAAERQNVNATLASRGNAKRTPPDPGRPDDGLGYDQLP